MTYIAFYIQTSIIKLDIQAYQVAFKFRESRQHVEEHFPCRVIEAGTKSQFYATGLDASAIYRALPLRILYLYFGVHTR